MTKIYTLLLLSILLVACNKDSFRRYDKRIIGTWRITDVDRRGWGGSTSRLDFTNGSVTFYDDGRLEYNDPSNRLYKGRWDIELKADDDETDRTLELTAVDFVNQDYRSEFYDEMIFVSKNHFRTTIYSAGHSYVTHFKR
jgi:hypothetical protein